MAWVAGPLAWGLGLWPGWHDLRPGCLGLRSIGEGLANKQKKIFLFNRTAHYQGRCKKDKLFSGSEQVFRCVHASLYEGRSIRQSVHRSVGWLVYTSVRPWSVPRFFFQSRNSSKNAVQNFFRKFVKKLLKISQKISKFKKKICPSLWAHLCSNELVPVNGTQKRTFLSR